MRFHYKVKRNGVLIAARYFDGRSFTPVAQILDPTDDRAATATKVVVHYPNGEKLTWTAAP